MEGMFKKTYKTLWSGAV